MPLCPTCRKEHVASCGNDLFISVNIPCAITLEDVPSEQCWSLPCGHTFSKQSLRDMGFTEKKEVCKIVEKVIVREVVRNETRQQSEVNLQEFAKCPITNDTHEFEFDEATSNYANDIESYKCKKCNIICNEYHEIYRNTRRVLCNREKNRQNGCNHSWRIIGGNYSMDSIFEICSICNECRIR
jgi:hypothetical protein